MGDLLNGVYKIDGMLHRISLTVMAQKYEMFAYCRLVSNAICKSCPAVYPYSLRLRKDATRILNALLMDMMDKIIDQCNVHELALRECMEMGTDIGTRKVVMHIILESTNVAGYLRKRAVNCSLREIACFVETNN